MASESQPLAREELCRRLDLELQRINLSWAVLFEALDRLRPAPLEQTDRGSVGNRLAQLLGSRGQGIPERAQMGCNVQRHARWKYGAAVPLIYLPILVGILPMILCTFLVRAHLSLVGGHQIKGYWTDFVPRWISHRYTYRSQIVPSKATELFGLLGFLARSKLFWIFNCKLYCPLSVALIAYMLYLVKIVEQWWCPFKHSMKHTYGDVPIGQSFWHTSGDSESMHPEDRDNPSWNRNVDIPSGSGLKKTL